MSAVIKPLRMSLKAKMLVSFTLAMSIGFVFLYRWFYQFSTQQNYQQLQEDVNQVLNAALVGIDAQDLQGLSQEATPRSDGHTDDLRYWTLTSWLALVESANPDARLYTYTKSTDDLNIIQFLGSGSGVTTHSDQTFLSSQAPPKDSILLSPSRQISSQLVVNDAGVWIQGVTPILDEQGQAIAMLGVDVKAERIQQSHAYITRYLLLTFFVSYIILFATIYILSEIITRRLQRLSIWTNQIAGGNYTGNTALQPGLFADEIDSVGINFQCMVKAIENRELALKESEKNLEHEVTERTAKLAMTLRFEAAIRRITNKIHESLDETHIFKTAIDELCVTLDVWCCNVGLYNLEAGASIINYGCSTRPEIEALTNGRIGTAPFLEQQQVYQLLLDGQWAAFCPLEESQQFSILACPIITEANSVLGDIWLFRPAEKNYSEDEINLTQQVADCCLIALRQARLYRETQARLEEMENLHRLKDDFLSTVSHELRTPITNMKMALKMLQTNGYDPAKKTRYFNILESEVKRESDLISDLLDLQRLDAGGMRFDLEPVDLNHLLPSIIESFEARASDRQLQLSTNIQTVPPITSDLAALKRIISELLNNACKYTPDGEKICIETYSEGVNRVAVCVTNYGIELPGDECDRIFEKFYRVPKADRWKQGGTGLGLALVKRLIQELGGEIYVESLNSYVKFTLHFPQFIST